MEWSLSVVRPTDAQPHRFPFVKGQYWLTTRLESGAAAVARARSEGCIDEYYLDEKCYMPLGPDVNINRWHCQFVHEVNGAWLRDYDSRNGTFLNGVLATGKCALNLDDVIQISKCEIFVTATATIDPAWLAWENAAVVELAADIRKTRDFARLPVLGDHLRNAGCTDVDILNHCLDPHRDPPRCCVLDILLENAGSLKISPRLIPKYLKKLRGWVRRPDQTSEE